MLDDKVNPLVDGHGAPLTVEEPGAEDCEESVYVCRRCKHGITMASCARSLSGRHVHVFNNPAGLVFRIGCFDDARGAEMVGQYTLEATWFAGVPWRYAHCGGCGVHLGWHYGGAAAFWGLILGRLEERSIDSA